MALYARKWIPEYLFIIFLYLLQRMDQAIYSSTKVTLWLWLEIPRDEGTLSLKNTITLFMFLSNIWNWKDQSRFMYFCVPFLNDGKIYCLSSQRINNLHVNYLFVTICSNNENYNQTQPQMIFQITKIKEQDQKTQTRILLTKTEFAY